jgi:periplasmic protein TonB
VVHALGSRCIKSSIIDSVKKLSTFQLALIFSVAAHAVLLSIRFVDPEGFNRVFQDTPLEVILVNAKSNERPEQAQAIAQASLAGGGEADKGRATSPVPVSALTELGDATEDEQKQIEELQEQQKVLLAQVKSQIAAIPETDPQSATNDPQARAQQDRRKQLIKLLAEIEKRINEENARPKKRYISPATREEVYAIYYDQLRRKIEERGTENFPTAAGLKLYGELTMILTVNHTGQILEAEVIESSANVALDRRALTIAKAAGPFGKFTDAMRRKADQIVVVSRFKFTREETLETKLTAR